MSPASYLTILFYLLSLVLVLFVGRSTLKTKTIQTQAEYIVALEKDRNFYKDKYEDVRKQNENQEQRIKFLEEMLLRGSSRMVQTRPEMGPRRKRRRDGTADPEAGEDGEVR